MSKVIDCPYYIVRNQKEKIAALRALGFSSIVDVGFDYPYVIGRQRKDVFQSQSTTLIEKTIDEETGEEIRYIKKDLPQN